ncbi:TIGR03986 family CRISPR-associated RAMP protein [Candidatus Acidulodesulfobacterium sp. H_13]|uniref:TIGR03986 family type III CRISPR-associated RAMP protein n=1 Tax=Candidatus Acidulodesulfobacterium sp. H_13 TaxID=3395470 RepID=UPI003AF73423
MDKAKLSVSEGKHGKLTVRAIFIDTEKGMPIQNFNHKDAMSLDGKEVDIERDKGQIIKILLDGEVIYSPSMAATYRKQVGRQTGKQQACTARAPYNFIPLNDIVAEAEKPSSFDTYRKDRLTGSIELRIEAKTPFYIRDTMDYAQLKEGKEVRDISDFCSTAGRPRIPGSSLRGMTRTMVEIVSFGKFGFFDDKRLYFRAVADKSKLGEYYEKTMVDKKNHYFPKIKAGILKKSGRKYRIYPSKTISKTQIFRINFDKLTKVIDGTTGFIVPSFDFRDVYYKPVAPADHLHTINKKTHKLLYAKLASISTIKNVEHTCKGFIIASGEFGNKKHMHWVINEPDTQFVEIDETVIDKYKNDVNRKEETDLLNKLTNHHDGVPCFYITDDKDKIIFFGHTGMFRLAYKKTIGEHVPEKLKNDSKIDLAEAIFGNDKTFAGRVFFEDAFCNQKEVAYEGEKNITLLGPKPTAFQHYLEQKRIDLTDHPKNLAHYNLDNNIRGNKLYWHKSGKNSANNDHAIFNEKTDSKINPVKAGTTFTGKIRFENLSRVELGAFLFVIDLPEGCYHKLGMGKPLGLGSVKISPKLFISDRTNRYKNLFAEWETPIAEADKSEYKKEFESYVLETQKDTQQTLWDNVRMKELKAMLDFAHKPNADNIGYMNLKQFRERDVLPSPTDVK